MEEFVDHEDDYLFDSHYHFDRHHDDLPTFRSFIGDHVPSWIAHEIMDPEDMYWYGRKVWITSLMGHTGTFNLAGP